MIVITNVRAMDVSPPGIQEGVDICIDKGKILEIGPGAGDKYPETRKIDGSGLTASPGLVCSHNHFYSALARGIQAEIKPSTDFISVLRHLWWKLDRAIDRDILFSSGITAALDAVRCGTTTVIDHHASPGFITGSLSVLQETFEKAGLRGILCYEVTDRNGEKGAREGVKESISFAEKEKNCVEASIGAHAPFTLSGKTLGMLREAVQETKRGIHIHIAEDAYDPSYSHGEYGIDIARRLEEYGLLNDLALCIHGVHLSEADLDVLKKNNCFLVHNPRSNLNNQVGYARAVQSYPLCALGTDGIGSDMLTEMRFAFFANREHNGRLWEQDILNVLWRGNSICEKYFGGSFGRLAPGNAADIVLWDYQAPTPLTESNIGGHFIYGFSAQDVHTVLINGKIVYENRQFPFDVSDFYRDARKQAKQLWERMDALEI